MGTGKIKVIIFGSGQIGHDAFMFLGADHVYGFCDNNSLLADTKKYGKHIYAFEKLKGEYKDSIVIIAVAGNAAYEIAVQCEENGIEDYLIYRQLREAFPEYDGEEMLHFIGNPLNRMRTRKNIYYKRAAQLKGQLHYFKSHADIRSMKPATGELRYRQKLCVQASSLFFKKIEQLKIKPMLHAGSLLGYVRHGGFIPWDDDVDFALIRMEYEKLKEYCRRHIYTEDEWQNRSGAEKNILPGLERYYWHLWHDHFTVIEVREDGSRVGIDFFSLDYYADHYSMAELRDCAAQMRNAVICKNSEEEKIQYVEQTLERNKINTAEESDYIYYGLDSMRWQIAWHKGSFIPRDVVFPLKEVLWEGEQFWVPNDAEAFLTYEYESPWDFPNDVGIPSHLKMNQEEM